MDQLLREYYQQRTHRSIDLADLISARIDARRAASLRRWIVAGYILTASTVCAVAIIPFYWIRASYALAMIAQIWSLPSSVPAVFLIILTLSITGAIVFSLAANCTMSREIREQLGRRI
jgi:hypothetical protein